MQVFIDHCMAKFEKRNEKSLRWSKILQYNFSTQVMTVAPEKNAKNDNKHNSSPFGCPNYITGGRKSTAAVTILGVTIEPAAVVVSVGRSTHGRFHHVLVAIATSSYCL